MDLLKIINLHEFFNKNNPDNRPFSVDIELTERCNNRCIHCYINQPEHAPDLQAREMATEVVKSILQQAAGLGCLDVRFTGGEPLLRSDFTELYTYARRLGLGIVTTFTKFISGWWSAHRAGAGKAACLRAGSILVTHGEFSILIAGLGLSAGFAPQLGAFAAVYVLILSFFGPIMAQVVKPLSIAYRRIHP